MTKRVGIIALLGFIGVIFAANYAVEQWGIVSVGFGLVAPAAVYFVGVAFTLRDLVQRTLGRGVVALAILIGAALSALVSPRFAVASGVAFGVSEALDFLIYTPLEERNWMAAVTLSGTVGLVVDSVLFLWLAFGSFDFLAGQIVGKSWVLAASILLVLPFRQRLAVQSA